ncbi:MAG: lipopolysaccharide biosynthesis protein [Gammaproteobacteria bacterium]|nr:lipopolysaccharide biosynthesis protein [Gammaproteobacteria bacterium]
MIRKILNKNSAFVGFDQVISSGSNFVFSILYARLLGPQQFGLYGLILFIAFLLLRAEASFIAIPMTVKISRYKEDRGCYMGYLLLKTALLMLVVVACSCVMAMVKMLGVNYHNLLYVSLFLCFFVLFDLAKKYCLAVFRYQALIALDISYVLLNSFALYLVLPLKHASQVFVISGVSYCCVTVVGCFLIFKRETIMVSLSKSLYFLRDELRSMWHLFLSSFLQWGNSTIPRYVLNYLSGATYIGILNGYLSLVGFLNPLFLMMDNVILPRLSHTLHNSGFKQARDDLNRYMYVLSGCVLLMIVVIGFSGEWLIKIVLGSKYIGYNYVFDIILVSYFFQFLIKRYYYLANLVSRQDILSKAYGIVFVVMLCSCYFVVKYLQIMGVAILMASSMALMFLMVRHFSRLLVERVEGENE